MSANGSLLNTGDIGSAIGSQLGAFLGGSNVFAKVAGQTVGSILIGDAFQGGMALPLIGQGLAAMVAGHEPWSGRFRIAPARAA
jgi:hypothetical protein